MVDAENFVRFMRHVELGPEVGSCWIWTGNKPDGRYGHFSVDGKTTKAHRWIYEQFYCQLADAEIVRHKCDNPPCVNPAHLQCGSFSDNTRDAIERGRWPDRQGEKHPLARLSESDVLTIRRRAACGETQNTLAIEYGLSRQHIGKIVRRENWRHV
jgi:hypothetical protein